MLTIQNTKRDFEQARPQIAVLPVGAVEQHGSHLPVGTDHFIASALAERVAERLDAFLLPFLSIASSIEHRKSAGTVYLKAATLAQVVRDIAESLHGSGYEKLVVINGHGGNWILKPTVRQLNVDLEGLDVVLIHTSVAQHRAGEVMERPQGDIHAGEKETSLMLHLHPDLVKDVRDCGEQDFPPQEYMDYFDTSELTEDGYWGYPQLASAEKGERMLELMTECAIAYIDKLEAYRAKVQAKTKK